jgi:glycosyltransferase involved in cell wall biosynthesis
MGAKTRVLFLQSSSDFWSVTAMHTLLMRYLDRDQIDVHVACNPGSHTERSAALSAIQAIPDTHLRPTNFGPSIYHKRKSALAKTLLTTGLPAIASPASLVGYVKRQGIDLVYAAQMPRDALWGVALAKLTGIKSIIHLHMKFGPWLGSLVPWAMRHADGIIACSRFTAQSAIHAGGYPPEKVYPVLNSLDIGCWDPATDGKCIRQEFAIPPEAPLLASIAFQAPRKGGEQLLKALALLKRDIPRFKLLMVGDSIPLDQSGQRRYTDTLKALTRDLGLTENVIFTNYRSDVRQILAACDLYAMPSDEEPFGLVFLEAMAMKKPVVAIANGGTPEIVEHGKAGLLAPPGDIPCLAGHLRVLLSNPELRHQMGAYGRCRVEQDFHPHRMAQEVEHICQQVLGKQTAPITSGREHSHRQSAGILPGNSDPYLRGY